MTSEGSALPNESLSSGSDAEGVEGSPVSSRRGLGRAVEAGLSGESVTAQGVLAAIGGWRGVFESLVPATVFLVTFVVTREDRLSAIAPLAIAVIAMIVRLFRREPLTAAFSGLVGVLVCVAAVMFTGEGSSYFVPGFWINGAWVIAHTVSLLIGWPLIGLLLGTLRGSITAWRQNRRLVRAAQLCTVVWIALFACRLAVQLPMYFAHQAGESGAIEALGIARLVMGVPLFALAVIFTWLVLSRVSAAQSPLEGESGAANAGGQAVEPQHDPQSSDE